MKNLRITRGFSFDAAHFLPEYPGKCANMHGHTWKVEITVEGAVKRDGLVFDFSLLKKLVEPWLETLDHCVLNDVPGLEVPTAENLVLWFHSRWRKDYKPVRLVSIRVHESPDNYCEWINEL